jgi:hypothetical protein
VHRLKTAQATEAITSQAPLWTAEDFAKLWNSYPVEQEDWYEIEDIEGNIPLDLEVYSRASYALSCTDSGSCMYVLAGKYYPVKMQRTVSAFRATAQHTFVVP